MAVPAGETDLQTLLGSMLPVLDPYEYVFCSVAESSTAWSLVGQLQPEVVVRETEGLTLVLPREIADGYNQTVDQKRQEIEQGQPAEIEVPPSLQYSGSCAKISLQIHSSLEAVGLTAAFSARLGQVGISANVVAGYYHDHIFVTPMSNSEKAMDALRALSTEARGEHGVV
jgi:hypothetical protein